MAEKKKCDYCGKIFYKDGFMNELGSASGVGDIVGGVRDLSRIAGGGRNFCSTKCKNAYRSQKGGGGAADALGLSASSQRKVAAEQKQKESERLSSLQDVVSIKFGDEPQEIFIQMQTAETYFQKHKEDDGRDLKALLDAISQKMDEGVYKIKSLIENEEDYYYKQAVSLQQKFQKKALRKKRSIPLLASGLFSFLLPFTTFGILTEGKPGGYVLGLIVGVILFVASFFLIRKFIK